MAQGFPNFTNIIIKLKYLNSTVPIEIMSLSLKIKQTNKQTKKQQQHGSFEPNLSNPWQVKILTFLKYSYLIVSLRIENSKEISCIAQGVHILWPF